MDQNKTSASNLRNKYFSSFERFVYCILSWSFMSKVVNWILGEKHKNSKNPRSIKPLAKEEIARQIKRPDSDINFTKLIYYSNPSTTPRPPMDDLNKIELQKNAYTVWKIIDKRDKQDKKENFTLQDYEILNDFYCKSFGIRGGNKINLSQGIHLGFILSDYHEDHMDNMKKDNPSMTIEQCTLEENSFDRWFEGSSNDNKLNTICNLLKGEAEEYIEIRSFREKLSFYMNLNHIEELEKEYREKPLE